MSTYSFASLHGYDQSGTTFTLSTGASTYLAESFTISENGDNDNSFDMGENDLSITFTAYTEPNVSYLGTLSHAGTTFLVFVDSYGPFLAAPDAAVIPASGFPASFDTSDIQTVSTPICFTAGTLIATPDGEKTVETLSIGDVILTGTGARIPVKWVGRQTVIPMFGKAKAQPVRIRKGALGDGLPHTDLTVTADHGMIIDGLVINASALVNGDTIDFVPMAELEDSFTVYHIETEAHDVILANGAAAETFIDYAGRTAFDNHEEHLALYGCEKIVPEMDRPRISTARLVPEAIKTRLGMAAATPDALLEVA